MSFRPARALALTLAALAASSLSAETVPPDRWSSDAELGDDFFGDVIHRYQGYRDVAAPASAPTAADPAAGYGQPGQYGIPASISQQSQLPQNRTPWSSVWWPRRPAGLAFQPLSQGLSPLEKFDTMVWNRTGRNPLATLWEADPANAHNEAPRQGAQDWAGHCNGLAAASILVPEPPAQLRIQLQRGAALKLQIARPEQAQYGITRWGEQAYRTVGVEGGVLDLTSDDLKGWLSEQFMACTVLQFRNPNLLGTRYNRPQIDWNDPSFQDIYPHYFHFLLQDFLKNRQQSLVIEVDPHMPVNNHPAYAFQANGTRQGNAISVHTRVWLTDYAPTWQFRGTQGQVRDYTYTLWFDQWGRVAGGQWTGDSVVRHPDFCWIPTGDRAPWGNVENPRLDPQWVTGTIRQAQGW